MRVSTSPLDGDSERASPIAPAILIVDDHAPNLLALEAVLAPLGHRLVRAASGEEALRRVLSEQFAVILLDVMMPGLDGFQTAAILKQRDKSGATPIIFITALTREIDLAAGYAHGAVDYLVKPYDPLILRAKVEVFVELYRSREEIARQAAALREREVERDELRREMTASQRAREQAEASEAAHRILAESIPQQVWTATSDGALDYVNPVVLRYFDQTAAEVLGAGWQAVIHPDDLPACITRWSESLVSGRDYEIEFRLRRHDGAYRWHLGRAVPMRGGADGGIVRWFGTNTDIDDRRSAEAELRRQEAALRVSEERFQLLAEVIPQMVWSISPDGHDAYLSPRWYEYTGQAVELPLTEKWRRAIHPEDYDRCFAQWAEAQARRSPWELEYRLRRADGVYRFHLGRSVPHCDRDGNITRWFGTATDIDEHRRAIRSRDDLLATVSHDLRNPLGAITLATALLRRTPAEGELGNKLARHLGTIERAAARMEQLISDLLDLARIESGFLSVELRPHDVRALVDEALEAIQPQAAARQLRLESNIEGPLVVQCDRGRALQVLSNILGNAVKFTPPSGSITITAAPADRLVQFALADTGPGIEPDQLPHIFDRFWQAKSTARAGTGLGLAICKGIVEQHGGSIRVESQFGAGTTFYFTLPGPDGR